MKKIAVIGCPGAGKSTLSKKLGESLEIEVFHLDRLYWKPGWVETPREDLRAIQEQIVKQDTWIIDGNFSGTLDIRLEAADTIVFLDVPRIKCCYRVLKRRFMYHGKTRPDIGEGCPERIPLEFLRYVWKFQNDQRPQLLERLSRLDHQKCMITLSSEKDIDLFLELANQERILREEISASKL
ncbi:DNA topology modulation protein [Pseudalkalibacillus berkeleyi]|uniref:DNA topology modulation protein n=1 Tax=Pseudalkalibacillus berkeleyi TaxID=1069813 RepID=A0ABS9GX76_9BACL|nr:DNA topology modulation protein [Pseudalkalibacillus berkeleyi]MCF6136426.1 DNA topology modulation protein [Pseudalkalibacillus berkeleyi]